jgi:hypothetical protein
MSRWGLVGMISRTNDGSCCSTATSKGFAEGETNAFSAIVFFNKCLGEWGFYCVRECRDGNTFHFFCVIVLQSGRSPSFVSFLFWSFFFSFTIAILLSLPKFVLIPTYM